ncbi:hypothetical protein HBH70_073950 [Parastagonospora nodorum]|nr:hypothetical protein HBH51_161570 [Parastagonospora nodorum]KAH4057774.1 hypothetical protein HBH50_234860 [Parastagonospora nodorum]KAH4079209.1 hypothetical protein HBH48_220820 [Parastagonospora nodorum]KAH4412376.1 hypothetical protein HBH92_111200 [Parastagonospora nodorum]KAH4439059.1 hypothetical protein HBH93_091600 [Parastagonospora nodorum]
MSTARISTRALRALTSTSTSTSKTTTRSLSITGPTTFSSILTSDKPTGTRSAPRLPNLPPPTNDTGKPARHFNTSRTLKAVNDSSTIDFAYLPESGSDAQASNQAFRVPILPGREASDAVKARNTEAETPVFIPVVSTASADDTHIHAPSALSETTSDLQGLASSVAKTLQTRSEGEGMTKQILNDLWEDIVELGQGGKPLAKA